MTHFERVISEIVEEIKGLSLKGALGPFVSLFKKVFVTLSGLCKECERGEVWEIVTLFYDI